MCLFAIYADKSRKRLITVMTFEQKPKGNEEASQLDYLGRTILGRGNSKYRVWR